MKPEYPALYAKTSMFVAVPIIMITLCFYVSHSVSLPAKDLYPMAITAFGTTIALAGVCFTMAPTKTGEPTIRYAGEKFLHSSLLLIQSIIVIYTKDALLNISIIELPHIAKYIIIGVFTIVISYVASMAAITWLHGFDSLNDELWKNYKKRIDIKRKLLDKKPENLKSTTQQP